MDINAFLNNIAIIAALYIWTLAWTGLALWKAAQKHDKAWFVILILPINTIALLQILYIYVLSREDFRERFLKLFSFFKPVQKADIKVTKKSSKK